MDDVVFGFVHDFGSGEEWTAVRGGGAFLNGVPLTGAPEGRDRVPVDRGDPGRRSSTTELAKLAPLTDRVRIMGAQAITFCHLAAGRTDAVVVPEAVAQRRLRRLAAPRPRARLRDPRGRRARARDDPARPRGALADLRCGHRGARAEHRRGATLLGYGTVERRGSRRARERHRPGAAQAGHRARHGPRDRDRRRRRDRHDRAHRRRLPAPELVPGAGRARGRRRSRASRPCGSSST